LITFQTDIENQPNREHWNGVLEGTRILAVFHKAESLEGNLQPVLAAGTRPPC